MIEDHRKHSLGHRAFLLFLSRRLPPVVFWALFATAVWYSERWIPDGYGVFAGYAAKLLFLVAGAYFIMILLRAWLEYRYYTYTFTEEAFMMTYGYVTRKEVAALYHQIQNVNIERSVFDRLAGVSQVVIMMTGSEHGGGQSKIVLPAVGKTKAKLVQKELLVRARRHVPRDAGNAGTSSR